MTSSLEMETKVPSQDLPLSLSPTCFSLDPPPPILLLFIIFVITLTIYEILLMCQILQGVYMYYIIYSSQYSYEIEIIIIFILQMRKVWSREEK